MDSKEFEERMRSAMGGAGWQTRLSKAIGVRVQTVNRWVSDNPNSGLSVPEYAVAILECLEAVKEQRLPMPKRFQNISENY